MVNMLLPLAKNILLGNMAGASELVSKEKPSVVSDRNKVVSIIPVKGVILKYGYCGEMGLVELDALLQRMDADTNVDAIILDADSGGGAASYLPNIAATLQKMKTPVFTYFSGQCCSAMYYIASQTQSIFASTATDEVGSIGTVVFFEYENPKAENAQIKTKVIYASKSTHKHEEYNAAIAGNDQPMIERRLDPLNQTFISNVMLGRPDVSEDVLNGRVFNASEGVDNKLIDGIGTLDEFEAYVLNMLEDPAAQSTMKFNYSPNTNSMKKSYYDKVSSIVGRPITSHDDLTAEDYEKISLSMTLAPAAANPTPEPSAADPVPEPSVSAPAAAPIDMAAITQMVASTVGAAIQSAMTSEAFQNNVKAIVNKELDGPAAVPVVPAAENPDGAANSWEDPNSRFNKQIEEDLKKM